MTDEFVRDNYKRKSETFRLQALQNQTVDKTFLISKAAKYITSLELGATDKSKLYFRGALSLRVESDQIFEKLPAQFLTSAPSVAIVDRQYDLGMVETVSQDFSVSYDDRDNAIAPYDPYEVFIHISYLIEK